jgi:peptidoglycan hydrolase-like protein with peptidoglycan-binding domain
MVGENRVMKTMTKIGTMLIGFLTCLLLFIPNVQAETAFARPKKALDDQISGLLGEIQKIQKELAAIPRLGAVSSDGACVFERDLYLGRSGEDVSCLQRYLFEAGQLGSVLYITSYFGPLTEKGVISWQKNNKISPAAGYFGKISQKKYYEVITVGVATGSNSVSESPATGSQLSVLSGVQPNGEIAPVNGARIPLLKLVLAASSDGDVMVKNIQVTGETLETRSALDSLILLNDVGEVIGEAQIFDGNLNVLFKEPFRVRAGTVQLVTVAGNRAAHTTGEGQTIQIALTKIDAGEAAITGVLPILGELVQVDTVLSIGQATVERSNFIERARDLAPGVKSQTFASLVLKASEGDLILRGIRWYQGGNLQEGDITNLIMKVGSKPYSLQIVKGTQYFSAGSVDIMIPRGESLEISVQGDVLGGSDKSFAFNIVDPSDIWLTHSGSGFGVMPTRSTRRFSKENPWQQGTTFSVMGGVIRVREGSGVSDYDVAVGVANQIVAAFDIEVYGEPVSVEKIGFKIQKESLSETFSGSAITNVIFEGPKGVLAGPVDEKAGRILFSGPVTFPIGSYRYVLKGKISPSPGNSAGLNISADPQADWGLVKGLLSDKKIAWEERAAVSGGAFVIKPAVINVAVLNDLVSERFKYNTRDAILALFQLDATKSGENIRVGSLTAQLTAPTNNSQSVLRNCRIFDDKTILNTGENIVYPKETIDDTSFYSFTINANLVVTKGSVKTIALGCDITSGLRELVKFSWGLPKSTQALVSATGVISGLPAEVKLGEVEGVTVTVSP